MWTTESRSRYDRRGLRYPSDLADSELVIPYARQIMNLVGDAKKAGSVESLKARQRCGARPCAFQIFCTVATPMPTAETLRNSRLTTPQIRDCGICYRLTPWNDGSFAVV
jgi:hypothetical protein